MPSLSLILGRASRKVRTHKYFCNSNDEDLMDGSKEESKNEAPVRPKLPSWKRILLRSNRVAPLLRNN